jgi:hypothetical protein
MLIGTEPGFRSLLAKREAPGKLPLKPAPRGAGPRFLPPGPTIPLGVSRFLPRSSVISTSLRSRGSCVRSAERRIRMRGRV